MTIAPEIQEHLDKAAYALGRAEQAADNAVPIASSWALIAQAHLAAANVKDLLGVCHGGHTVLVPEGSIVNDTETR